MTATTPAPADAPSVSRAEWVGLGLLAAAVGGVVVASSWGIFTPDTRPDLYQDPGRFLSSSVQAWVGGATGLGQSNFNAGAAPVAAVVWVIRALGASPWLAVRIWRLLLLLVAAVGVRRYLGVVLGPRLNRPSRLLVTAFYVANPYVVVAGNTTPILLPYALLPWTLLAFVQSMRHPRSWRWPAAFAVAFFLQAGLNAGVVTFFSLLALPGHAVYAAWVERRPWRQVVASTWRCGLLALLVSLYWLAPSVLATGTGTGIAEATENPVDVARTSSYAESGRLLGAWPLYGRAGDRLFLGGYTSYLTNPFVLVCSFLVLVAAGASLIWTRGRERLLVVGLLVLGLPAMVGLFPPDSPYPAGRFLGEVFDRVPAALAFRTTNKAGAVVVVAYALAFALGVRAYLARRPGRRARVAGVAAVLVVLVGASGPMWTGKLYPLGYQIPARWHQATDDLDARDPDNRVLVVPGGTGGNYRWGMRSPDDLFPSLLDRPVAVRNTVSGRGSEAGNFLAGYDTLLAQGALAPGALSTVARYLGASQVLVRNDLLTEEIGGPSPALVAAQTSADRDLDPVRTYGRPGTDTLPGRSGRPTRAERADDPRNASLAPIEVLDVADPEPVVRSVPVGHQLVVDGDGEAFPALSREDLLSGAPAVRYLGSLDRAGLRQALADGAGLVLTDTNRRRAWDINRVTNATSATLAAGADIDAGNGATVTLWPDDATKQTVTELLGASHIEADQPAFGLHPYGRPGQAFDGDPTTAWQTGGLGTAAGDRITLVLDEPTSISTVSVTPLASAPSRVSAVSVQVGATRVVQPIPAGTNGPIAVPITPTRADRVTVTILSQTRGTNPVGLSEVAVDAVTVREVTRLPRTLRRLTDGADAAVLDALAVAPLDIVLTRARGLAADLADDEEAQLDRRFDLPQAREATFTAELSVNGADPALVAGIRTGTVPADRCQRVAAFDDGFLDARVVSTERELADGLLRLQGCRPVSLDAGTHQLLGIFGWRLDGARFSSPGDDDRPAARAVGAADRLTVTERSATRIEARLGPSDHDRLVRIGEAHDRRWTLLVDGRDAGEPILVDGYSAGWRVPAGAHRLEIAFAPQRAVRITFVASALSLVGVVAIALLPVPAWLTGRRRRRHAVVASAP